MIKSYNLAWCQIVTDIWHNYTFHDISILPITASFPKVPNYFFFKYEIKSAEYNFQKFSSTPST